MRRIAVILIRQYNKWVKTLNEFITMISRVQ